MLLALVKVYSKTGVPSDSLPKSRFSMVPASAVVVTMSIPAEMNAAAIFVDRALCLVTSSTSFRMEAPPANDSVTMDVTRRLHCPVYAGTPHDSEAVTQTHRRRRRGAPHRNGAPRLAKIEDCL